MSSEEDLEAMLSSLLWSVAPKHQRWKFPYNLFIFASDPNSRKIRDLLDQLTLPILQIKQGTLYKVSSGYCLGFDDEKTMIDYITKHNIKPTTMLFFTNIRDLCNQISEYEEMVLRLRLEMFEVQKKLEEIQEGRP